VPYDIDDPRAQLAPTAGTVAGVPRAATYAELHDASDFELGANASRTWWTRSEAIVIAYTEAQPGDELTVETDAEYVALVLDGASVRVAHGTDEAGASDESVVIVPPGLSTVHVDRRGTLARIFAAATVPDLAARCANAGDYADADPNVAEFVAWPDPPDGFAIRVHALGDHPPEPGRLGAIFRCTTVMVNVFPEDHAARDPRTLSPHHHDDFEQVSLQVAGDYVHHMRVAWTPDSTTWRDDEHRQCASPAVVVIPPPLIHTTQSLGTMRHRLIDVFAPPRIDFSQRPGWVLNAGDYPMPS
jgi:hypothetical protein